MDRAKCIHGMNKNVNCRQYRILGHAHEHTHTYIAFYILKDVYKIYILNGSWETYKGKTRLKVCSSNPC